MDTAHSPYDATPAAPRPLRRAVHQRRLAFGGGRRASPGRIPRGTPPAKRALSVRKGWRLLGFGTDLVEDGVTSRRAYQLPYWAAAVLFSATPAAWLVARRRRREREIRRLIGLCHDYGYDLRASPERCPECGAAAAASRLREAARG